jgi:hypothetical protein
LISSLPTPNPEKIDKDAAIKTIKNANLSSSGPSVQKEEPSGIAQDAAVVVDSAEYAAQLTLSLFTATAMLTDNLTAPSPAYTLRMASLSVRTHMRLSSVSTRVCSCTSQELVTLCAVRNCRRIQEMNDNYEYLAAELTCTHGHGREQPNLASHCLCFTYTLHRSCVKTTSGAVSTQYWISVDHFSTRLNARVQERKGEVIQGLC